jgi:hypothetical protein
MNILFFYLLKILLGVWLGSLLYTFSIVGIPGFLCNLCQYAVEALRSEKHSF